MATFGSGAAPSQIIKNLDALFSTSLAAYKKKLTDNIGAINAFYYEIMKRKMYESDSGTHIEVPLMYALTEADSYDGYDELPMNTVDGITNAVFQWAQCAVPITISMKEIKQNAKKIVNLMDAKQKQADMGMQEYFSRAFLWGAGADGGSIAATRTSSINGSSSITPLGLMIKFDPTTSTVIGNINQSTSTWWRNKTKTSAATTYDALLRELRNIHLTCSRGTGGAPDVLLVDQVTFELIEFAFLQRYRQTKSDSAYPFENLMWGNTRIVMEDKVPDAFSDLTNTDTYGSVYLLNTQYYKVTYEEDSDFKLLKDENGKAFQKPINQDARVAHMAWMGNTTMSNRRKQGVFGKIARTLTVS